MAKVRFTGNNGFRYLNDSINRGNLGPDRKSQWAESSITLFDPRDPEDRITEYVRRILHNGMVRPQYRGWIVKGSDPAQTIEDYVAALQAAGEEEE